MSNITAEKILTIARNEIGTRATAVKKCKYNTEFYGSEVSASWADWCATFIWWVFKKANAADLLHVKTAGCGVLGSAFYRCGKFKTSDFRVGDIVFFHWSNARSESVPITYTLDHVGIIEKINNDGTITTIEGNTGNSAYGEVMRRTRSLSVISGVARPDYAVDTNLSTLPSVTYCVRTKQHGWLPEVQNLDDYAGIEGSAVTDVAIKVSSGSVKYRVHTKGGSWLPYVTGYSTTDTNKYAGNGTEIDAVEVYYFTNQALLNKGIVYKAKYRTSSVSSSGYYDWQYDDEKTNGQDGYAGSFGKSIDKLQIVIK